MMFSAGQSHVMMCDQPALFWVNRSPYCAGPILSFIGHFNCGAASCMGSIAWALVISVLGRESGDEGSVLGEQWLLFCPS